MEGERKMETIFKGIFDSDYIMVISILDFLLCIGVSLIIGIFLALVYTYKSDYTESFEITLALLPAIVCVVIMMVNGNVGAGVAVAGTFSLVRFRSVPGRAKEIAVIFLAMGAGLITGMGYLAYAIVFTLIMGFMLLFYLKIGFGEKKIKEQEKILKITIPEDLDYTGIFDDLLQTYTRSANMISVKTVNMGSMFKIEYDIILNDLLKEKEFIDELRCRNGNLEVSIVRKETGLNEL